MNATRTFVWLGATALALRAGIASAQEPLGLDSALQAGLTGHPALAESRAAVSVAVAEALAARRPFEYQLKGFLSGRRERDSALLTTGESRRELGRHLESGVSATKVLPWGPMLSTELSVNQSQALTPTRGMSRTLVGTATATLPLMNGWGGGLARRTAQASDIHHDGRVADFEHAIAVVALETAVAYWGYRAANERLAVLSSTEKRAAQLVDEIHALIRADERPAADADLLKANLASRRAQRMLAEQQLVEARQELGLAMGLSAAAAAALGPPATAFPDESVEGQPRAEGAASRATERAFTRRRDLGAARHRVEATALLWEGSRDALKPGLDLDLTAGYDEARGGALPVPGSRSTSGWSVALGLRYEPMLGRNVERARAIEAEASHRLATATAEALARRIESRALVAAQAVDRHELERQSVREAVRLSSAAVETEKKKFQLGLATLFDTILAEDALASALLQYNDARLRYVVALARLRFETAELVTWSAAGPNVELRRLLEPSPVNE